MQNEEDAQTNNAHDDQIQLGCAFHRVESRSSLRVYLQRCEFEWSEVEPTPAEGLTSEKGNYNFHQRRSFLSFKQISLLDEERLLQPSQPGVRTYLGASWPEG